MFTQSEAPTGILTKRTWWLTLHAQEALWNSSTTFKHCITIQFKQLLLMLRPHWPVVSRNTRLTGSSMRAIQISTLRRTSWTLPWYRKWRSPCTWDYLMILALLLPHNGFMSNWAQAPSRTGLSPLGKDTYLGDSREASGLSTIWLMPFVPIGEEGLKVS